MGREYFFRLPCSFLWVFPRPPWQRTVFSFSLFDPPWSRTGSYKNVTEARRGNQGGPSRAKRAGDRRERAPLVSEVGLSVAGKGGFTVQWSLFWGVLAVLR